MSAPYGGAATKPGPGRALGMRYSLWQEPWWNADRQARPQAEGGASRLAVARAARRLRADSNNLRLPAFRILFRSFVACFFVIAGHSRSKNGVASLAYARQSMR
jgi:hypothetical protein